MLSQFTEWLWGVVVKVFGTLWDLFTDLFVNALDLVVSGFASLIASIPVPAWMAGGLATPWGALDPGIVYVLTQCGMPAALGMIGAGYAFRFARKAFTLFQW